MQLFVVSGYSFPVSDTESFMERPINSSRRYEEFGSYDGLARSIINSFPNMQWGLTGRSLGAKIGELDKGKLTWWANNPEKAKCLAEFLEISLEDLGLHGRVEKTAFSFEDFPEFPPLDLKREELPSVAEEMLDPERVAPDSLARATLDEWLDKRMAHVRHPPFEMHWLQVEDELQRQLLFRKLAVAGPHEVLGVEALQEAEVRLRNPKPLIIFVGRDGGAEDLAALAGRPLEAGVLVIAPFMLAKRDSSSSDEFLSWESRTAHGPSGRVFGLTGREGIKRWTLVALPDWRERLLQWVEERLNRQQVDTYFSAQAVSNWLKDFDPLSIWFRSVSDVLQLCRLVHFDSEKRLPNPGAPDAGNLLVQLFFAGKPGLKYQIGQLADARWLSADQLWQGDLPLATWCGLSATGLASITEADLDEIVSGRTLAEREKAAERVASRLEAGNPEALVRSGLLREGQRASFDFRHRSFAELLVRDRLVRDITMAPLATWAMYCFDPGRRVLIDAAMAVLPMTGLIEVARRLAQVPADSVESLAVSETLFVAIGKRIARGEEIPSSLHYVANCVVSRPGLLDEYGNFQPWSRPVASNSEHLAWLCACWSWSLLPEAKLSIEASWLFPGWAEELPELPYWLADIQPDKKAEHLSTSLAELLPVLRQWSKERDAPFENAPVLFVLPFLEKAAQGAVTAEAGWWNGVADKRWAEKVLLDSLKRFGRAAATRLWPSYLAAEQALLQVRNAEDKYNFPYMAHRLSPIRFWLLEHLEPADILKGLDQDALRYLGLCPESLPPGVRPLLLKSLLACNSEQWDPNALPFLERFGFHAAPALTACLEHIRFKDAAVDCLWRWDAASAVNILVHGENASLEARRALLWGCPAQHFSQALAAVEKTPKLLDAEYVECWVRRYLPTSGRFAERAHALLGRGRNNEPISRSNLPPSDPSD
ncbi:hypothetical protein [Azonexus hydrophilus]|uniref:hypothetical protein n=1 Tax=Azonexus hydrophilus TaxID=418702 RepID=UPI00248F5648|nr:hypothetical protein [Azonexus hydrophilus]